VFIYPHGVVDDIASVLVVVIVDFVYAPVVVAAAVESRNRNKLTCK